MGFPLSEVGGFLPVGGGDLDLSIQSGWRDGVASVSLGMFAIGQMETRCCAEVGAYGGWL